MMRYLGRFALAAGALLLAVPARAEPDLGPPVLTVTGLPGRRLAIATPPAPRGRPRANVSPTIFLERCVGGCALHMGNNDARAQSSMLLLIPNATVTEFASREGLTGAAADAEWRAVVQCVKEVYSPYDVVVTDEAPASGIGYHEAIIAGQPSDVGRTADTLGVAPLANDCGAIDNVISISFANAHGSTSVAERVLNICWTAAQESAHAFGLDHEYAFVADDRSACSDPMTYRSDCGGQKFFRNEAASCGENVKRACRCTATQNSHAKLLSVFGAGTPITRPPDVELVTPGASDATLGASVVTRAGAQRGVARVELRINGNMWGELPGAPFQLAGQPDPSTYVIPVPAGLPDSIIDVQTVALDDLGATTASDVVTLTRGAPCSTAASCATGQRCEAGRCFWDPPTRELGDRCDYAQLCKSELCEGAAGEEVCTQVCAPGAVDTCPAAFECVQASASAGVCLPVASAGCCRVERGDPGWLTLGIGAVVLAFAIRKRRR